LKYRLLKEHEPLLEGDQELCEDCESWEKISCALLLCEWMACLFRPMRRVVNEEDT
jgi:hypothetical protein